MDTSHINTIENSIAKAKAFAAKYSEAEGMLMVSDPSTLCINKEDAAKAGKTFGKDGWTRKNNWSGKMFDWEKHVDGVRIVINEAEENAFIGSPVPEKSFPLEITEG
jgi:hypothetical protein